jgi:hypothetical protein
MGKCDECKEYDSMLAHCYGCDGDFCRNCFGEDGLCNHCLTEGGSRERSEQ